MTRNLHLEICLQFVAIFGCLISLSLLVALIDSVTPVPPVAYFTCNDDFKYPYVKESVNNLQCTIIWAGLAALIFSSADLVIVRNNRYNRDLFGHVLVFCIGGANCILISTFINSFVGKLSPYYMTICQPVLSHDYCYDIYGFTKVIEAENNVCQGLTNKTTTEKDLNVAKTSFISVQASFSFFCTIWLIMYYSRILTNLNHPVRPFVFKVVTKMKLVILLGIFKLAVLISCTQIREHKNFSGDVALSVFLGCFVGVISIITFGKMTFSNIDCNIIELNRFNEEEVFV